MILMPFFPIFLIQFNWIVVVIGDDEPLWFPDMTCHPKMQEEPWRLSSDKKSKPDRVGLKHFRNLALECKDYEKDDPCLKFCVLQKWNLAKGSQEGSHSIVMFSDWVFRLFSQISKARVHMQKLANNMRDFCSHFNHDSILYPIKKERMVWQCATNPQIFECIEGYLNCSYVGPDNHYIKKLKFFEPSCHPKIKPGAISYDSINAEVLCDHQFETKSSTCMNACKFQKMEMSKYYIEYWWAKKKGNEEGMENAVKKIAVHMPEFETENDQHDFVRNMLAACNDVWQPYNDFHECPKNKKKEEFFEKFLGCLEDFLACKK